jgi:CheY-like chemotaxis protein
MQTKLIEDLLDVSRISAGKLRIHPRVTALSPVVQAALDSVRPTADAKHVKLECHLPAVDERVNGDPDRLQQVFWNLLANAVKFTPANGTVSISLSRVEGQAEVAVRDTGLGISPNFLPYVFDRFRQADASSTRSHGGLGIGLTIVRHILELHGGTVRADSAGEGRGSTFTVRLPVSAVSEQPDSHGRNGDAAALDTSTTLTGVRILLVDDEPDAREVIAEILKRAGATVATAASAPEARSMLEKQRPDLLVSDIAMPEQDGYTLIQSIRRLSTEHGGATPAVALTAHAREEDRIRALAAGFHAHVVKPVEPAEFISVLARIATEFSHPPAATAEAG